MEKGSTVKTSQRTQILMTLVDNHQMSAKEVAKYLGIPHGSASALLTKLRQTGAVEHVGYSRYAITDDGRSLLRDIMAPKSLPMIEHVELTGPIVPIKSWPTATDSTTNWQEKYLALVDKILAKYLGGGDDANQGH